MSTKTATKDCHSGVTIQTPPAPQMDRTPRTLAMFQCQACSHVGVGRLEWPTGAIEVPHVY